MTDPAVLAAVAQALEKDPRNGPLWLHYAELLVGAARRAEAIAALQTATSLDDVRRDAVRRMIPLLREEGRLAEARIRAEDHLKHGEDAVVRAEWERLNSARAAAEMTAPTASSPAGAAAVHGDAPDDPEAWAAQFDWGDLRVRFEDVAGLEEVKRQIRLRIISPFRNRAVFEAFGRGGGGGILLYGPPGCGKTFVARATAGELGARFHAVSIHEVLDKYWGESEKLVHGLFERARRNKPSVLFFDEFDALGAVRGRGESQYFKTLVDSFLQQMDGANASNEDVLLMAATNVPWNVDSAFRRPGRFDRVLFVPPPDEPARLEILRRHVARLPGGAALDLADVARRCSSFSGADLKSLCERAAERALEESLSTGKVAPVTADDFARAATAARSTVEEWMATARNYARYSNEGGQFDELAEWLRKSRRW
jgi:transitional endoplasmic reticulum ATPase